MTHRNSTIGTRQCAHCGKTFTVTTKHPDKRYCGRSCAVRSWKAVRVAPPNPSGLCMCGCGQPVPRARRSSQKVGLIAGEYVRYLPNHHIRLTTPPYVVEDTGYKTPCHLWQRAIGSVHGYGVVRIDGKSTVAHVVAWEAVNGPVPDGMVLDHLCRVRHCINPDHLEPVTDAINIQRGALAKLTADDVREIRAKAGTKPKLQLAKEYGVSHTLIRKIIRREAWKNIE